MISWLFSFFFHVCNAAFNSFNLLSDRDAQATFILFRTILGLPWKRSFLPGVKCIKNEFLHQALHHYSFFFFLSSKMLPSIFSQFSLLDILLTRGNAWRMSEIKVKLTNNDFFRSCLCAVTQPTNLLIFLDLFLYFSIMLSREKRVEDCSSEFLCS